MRISKYIDLPNEAKNSLGLLVKIFVQDHKIGEKEISRSNLKKYNGELYIIPNDALIHYMCEGLAYVDKMYGDTIPRFLLRQLGFKDLTFLNTKEKVKQMKDDFNNLLIEAHQVLNEYDGVEVSNWDVKYIVHDRLKLDSQYDFFSQMNIIKEGEAYNYTHISSGIDFGNNIGFAKAYYATYTIYLLGCQDKSIEPDMNFILEFKKYMKAFYKK